MIYRVLDKNGNCLITTDIEKLARRFLFDNPERGYRLLKGRRDQS